MLDGDEVVFIARGSPTRVFSTGLDIGYRLPAFCTSVGRAMLGQLDNTELAAKLAAMRRETMTSYTVTDPELLLATIIADREKGYSLVDREAEPDFARFRCRCGVTTAPSSPRSIWARMSIASRPLK